MSATTVHRTTPIPRPISSLLGRDQEIAAVVELVASGARLVTVVGPAGSERLAWPLKPRAGQPRMTRARFRSSPSEAVEEHSGAGGG